MLRFNDDQIRNRGGRLAVRAIGALARLLHTDKGVETKTMVEAVGRMRMADNEKAALVARLERGGEGARFAVFAFIRREAKGAE